MYYANREMLYENEQFKERNLAALVASKVYYHLGSFDNALQYALGADKLFNVDESSEYVETIITKCIDHYTKIQVDNFQAKDASEIKAIDPRLEDIVNRMFQRFFDEKKFKQVIGLAIETRRLDVFEKAISVSINSADTIAYAYKITVSLISNRKFRNAILRLLVKLYKSMSNPDYVNMVQCLIYLDEPEQVANILENLIRSNNILMVCQLGLDLYESATQQFLLKVKNLLRTLVSASQPMETSEGGEEVPQSKPEDKVGEEVRTNVEKLLLILNGEITINTNMQFLIKNNHSDLLILKTIKVFLFCFSFFFHLK
jgi:26S proteasome regulatory subunit N2